MANREGIRAIARDIIADHEHWYRTQAHGLDKTVEADADQLLTRGVDLDPGATQEQRKAATLAAWQRVEAGRTRAAALRLVARILGLVLRAMGGTPKHDREAPPETARQARVGMFVESRGEESEWFGPNRAPKREPGDLNRAWVVKHADEVERSLGWPPHLDTCSGCALAASKGWRACTLGENCEGENNATVQHAS